MTKEEDRNFLLATITERELPPEQRQDLFVYAWQRMTDHDRSAILNRIGFRISDQAWAVRPDKF